MRHWMNMFARLDHEAVEEQGSFLREMAAVNTSRQLDQVAHVLSQHLGGLIRVGGPRRVYDVGGTGQKAALYVVGNTAQGVGLAWKNASDGVCAIYFWNILSPFRNPDFEVDLPPEGDLDAMAPQIATLLHTQRQGSITVPNTVSESRALQEKERQVSQAEFFGLAQRTFGKRANNLTWADIQSVARKNGVQIPPSIRNAQAPIRTSDTTWNLAPAPVDKGAVGAALGSELEDPEPVPHFQPMLQLAKAKEVGRLARAGSIAIVGRKPRGAYFVIPGLDAYSASMERLFARELQDDEDDDTSMEAQYSALAEKVEMIAGGRSTFTKSLLITGAPSSGKSYQVMNTVTKTLGLQEGSDYILSKGMLTRPELYRLLIEQQHGLLIIDDCDGIIEDKDAVNMLKGALDSSGERRVSYRVKGTINIGVLPSAQRDEYVDRLSRVLRQVPEPGDAAYFAKYARVDSAKNTKGKGYEPPEPVDDDGDGLADLDQGFDDDAPGDVGDNLDPRALNRTPVSADDQKIFDYVSQHLPNMIDYKGRIIFISNMEKDEWPSAIVSRSVPVNLSFSDEEMLGFFDKIKDSIDANLTSEQKTEVLDYLHQLWAVGRLNSAVNFRLLLQCFDYRASIPNWRRMIRSL